MEKGERETGDSENPPMWELISYGITLLSVHSATVLQDPRAEAHLLSTFKFTQNLVKRS